MRNYSITNLEQSKRLFYAGLKFRTADYIVDSTFSKVESVMNVIEKPIRIESSSDLKKAETSKYMSVAWSLGKFFMVRDALLPLETIDLSSSRSFSVSLTAYFRFGIAEFK